MSDVFPVVIIGGGLAGLTAGAHLAARGVPPLVLEADQRWAGGRLSGGDPETFTFRGRTWTFPTEHGIHALWGGYVNMRATLERFTDTLLLPSDGEEWINRWRREVRRVEAGTSVRFAWLPAPFHYLQLLFYPRFWTTINPLDFLSLPGFLASLLWTVGFDPLRERVPLDGLLMKDYFRGWTPNLRATFVGLGKNLLAAPEHAVTAAGFIAALRFFTMMRRKDWFPHYLPNDAHSTVIAPLIRAIEAQDGRVLHGATAERLERAPDNTWRVGVDDQKRGGKRSLEARHVILAVDAPAARRLLDDSPATADAAARLNIPDAVRTSTVRLWFSREPRYGTLGGMLTGNFAFDNFFWLHKWKPAFQHWHAETRGSAIELHLYGTDAQMDEADAPLLVRGVDEVTRAFPELRGHFVHGAVRRNSKTQAVFRIPTHDSLFVQTPWENIYACGDWIGYETPSLWMERACTTAIAAANAVLLAHGCEPYPLLQPPRGEPLARGLEALVRGGRALLGPLLRRSRRRGS